LIVDKGYLSDPGRIRYFSTTAEALRLLKKAGYLLIVVTNQSGVARGYYLEKDVLRVHNKIKLDLSKQGAAPQAFFYCPHYPGGKVKSLGRVCDCRKPKMGLVKQALRKFKIDLRRSYMVGDKMDDMLLSMNARMAGGILVKTGNGRKSEKDLKKRPVRGVRVASNLLQAAKMIIQSGESH
jgi:D-glycero-D-manno-heptose 1,7-bisphosphate phosphatase